jgi:hypothetical protein
MVCLNLLLLILSMQVVEMVGGAGTNNDPDRLRVAFCLTGQLARLEIISKIKHIFVRVPASFAPITATATRFRDSSSFSNW